MAQGRVRKGVETSIRAAVSRGDLDLTAHAAPIAMLRAMADLLDKPGGETPAMRYVTPASFMAYCEALRLTPSARSGDEDDGLSGMKRAVGAKFQLTA